MKSIFKKSMAVTIVVFMLILTAIPFASAATLLDESQKVSFTVNCDKPGYTFEVYEVAKLKNGNAPTFETAYESLFDGIADEVKSGKTKDILHKLDSLSPALSAMPATAISVGVFNSDDKTKTYSDLEQGIYYVKCTGFPAGVKSVENSVVVLPYFQNNSWIYTISPINLATKVADDTPGTEKEITNSTKNNKNFTDVNIGDTVDFALYNSTAGSSSMKLLNQKLTYKVFDKEVVEPDDITKLKVEHGKELLTLITCYPYGINSHRLLVHAKRVYTSGNAATADEIQIHTNTKRMSAIPIIGAVIVLSVISFSVGIVIHKRRKCDKSKHRQEGIKNA